RPRMPNAAAVRDVLERDLALRQRRRIRNAVVHLGQVMTIHAKVDVATTVPANAKNAPLDVDRLDDSHHSPGPLQLFINVRIAGSILPPTRRPINPSIPGPVFRM